MIGQSRKPSISLTFLTQAELSIILKSAAIFPNEAEKRAVRREFLVAVERFLVETIFLKNNRDRWKLTQSRVEFQSIVARISKIQKRPFSDVINDTEQNRPYIVFLAATIKIWSELASEPTFGQDEQGCPTRTIRFLAACLNHLGENIDPVRLDEIARKIWLGEITLKPTEIPKILWDHNRHYELFWPHKQTWKPIEKLLLTIAKQNEPLRKFEYSENGSRIANCFISHFSHEVHATVRGLLYDMYSREITQNDAPLLGTGKSRRQIHIQWGVQKAGSQQQLRRLQKAAASGSKYKWEKTWIGLTDSTRNLLGEGQLEAMKRGALKNFRGRPQVMGTVIPSIIPAAKFVQIIIPFALALGAKKDRPRREIEDQALADLIRIYKKASGRPSDGLIRGGYNEPFGECADFIQQIDAIFEIKTRFGIDLMPKGSVHAIRRARKLLIPDDDIDD